MRLTACGIALAFNANVTDTMQEVEKEVPSATAKGKRTRVRETEYCFEPELEGGLAVAY